MVESRKEYESKKRYFGKDNCPFCSSELEKENEVIKKTAHWIIIYNKYPYFGDRDTLLVFPKKHREFTSELTEEEFKDLLNVDKFMKEYFSGKDYFSFIRQTKSNKSVEHLHYHYLLGAPRFELVNGEKYFKLV